MAKHFIFGYGSLICPQSRAVTAPTLRDAVAEPVIINGIERVWSARVTKEQGKFVEDADEASSTSQGREHIRGWTPMGVRFRRGGACNGILIHVDDEELKRFDVREAGYVRQRIDLADVHRHVDSEELISANMPLWPSSSADESESKGTDSMSPFHRLDDIKCSECRGVLEQALEKRKRNRQKSRGDGSVHECDDVAVWVYVQTESLPAERSFPITQSYVDIIMRGCLSVSRDFARRFLETTHGWWHSGDGGANGNEISAKQSVAVDAAKDVPSVDEHHTWINDRNDPMYVRADTEYSARAGKEIDDLIKEHHPHALKRRVLSNVGSEDNVVTECS